MSFIYALNAYWTSPATTYNGIALNVTSAAGGTPQAAAPSRLLNLQKNSIDTCHVNFDGTIFSSNTPIPCTATQLTPNNIILTPTNGSVVTSIQDGMQFSFVPVAAVTAGVVYISVGNSGLQIVYYPDLIGLVTKDDIKLQQRITVQYYANVPQKSTPGWAILNTQLSYAQGSGYHPTIDFDTTGTHTVSCAATGGGGYIPLYEPTLGGFALREISAGGIPGGDQNLFNGTAYIEGVANQTLANNTFYYVYLFIPQVGNPNLFPAMNFSTTAPNNTSTGGMPIYQDLSGNINTVIGAVYTFVQNVQFVGQGNNCQAPTVSWWNPQTIQMQSSQGGGGGFTNAAFVEMNTNQRISLCALAREMFSATAMGYGSNNTATSLMGMKLGCNNGQFGSLSSMYAPAINAPVACNSAYGVALADGFYTLSPYVSVQAGVADFEVMTSVYARI